MNLVQFPDRTNEPRRDVLEKLEWALEQAKSGRLKAVAIAGVIDDGRRDHGWSAEGINKNLLAASILALQHRYGALLADEMDITEGAP